VQTLALAIEKLLQTNLTSKYGVYHVYVNGPVRMTLMAFHVILKNKAQPLKQLEIV